MSIFKNIKCRANERRSKIHFDSAKCRRHSISIKAYFRAVVFDCRLRHCRREANRLRAISGRKHLVIVLNRRPVVVAKQQIKNLIRDGFFRKGVTAADIETRAIYRTL